METHAYKLSVWEVEAEGPGIQGYPWRYEKFQTSLSYMSPYYKNSLNLERERKEEKCWRWSSEWNTCLWCFST